MPTMNNVFKYKSVMIIDDNELEIEKGLTENTFNRLSDILFVIVCGHDDTHFRLAAADIIHTSGPV